VSKQRSLDRHFEACLATWGISLLEEWDLLVFLHRHRKSLLTVEQICLLLGYGSSVVGKALETLEKVGLVRRSRSFQGIRFNQLVASVDAARQDSFELLMNLLETPLARGLVAGRLARATGGGLRRTGLYLT
jgi:DNA-binding MarR family transcriptional regulator